LAVSPGIHLTPQALSLPNQLKGLEVIFLFIMRTLITIIHCTLQSNYLKNK